MIGTTGLKLFNNLAFTALEDSSDVQLIIDKLDTLIIGQVNVIYERYVFNNCKQQDEESIDAYVADLRKLPKTCQFCQCLETSLIRDRLVIGISHNATRKVLLQKRDLNPRPES